MFVSRALSLSAAILSLSAASTSAARRRGDGPDLLDADLFAYPDGRIGFLPWRDVEGVAGTSSAPCYFAMYADARWHPWYHAPSPPASPPTSSRTVLLSPPPRLASRFALTRLDAERPHPLLRRRTGVYASWIWSIRMHSIGSAWAQPRAARRQQIQIRRLCRLHAPGCATWLG